tara:strand:- start:290 stop:898 length:609 start_codon:yes stop_codon:yes gene_type:complete
VHTLITLIVSCLIGLPCSLSGATPEFACLFKRPERRTMEMLVRQVDKRAAKRFSKLKGSKQAIFLSRFWDDHCPRFSKLYVDFQLGQRRPNASPSFYNDPDFLTPDYWVYVATKDSLDLGRTTALLETLLESNPSDGVGMIALGYCYLESDSLEQAEAMFLEARKHHRKEPAVYNGLGFSWVKRPNGQTVGRDYFSSTRPIV